MRKLILILGFLLAYTWSFSAPLDASLKAFKVTHDAAGAEVLVAAETAVPGDVVEYQATYTNTTDKALTGVSPELPIPEGLTYVEGSAQPAPSQGSLDGKTFKALPLKDAQGNPVPTEQVRSLRWTISTLAPSASATIRLRASVNR